MPPTGSPDDLKSLSTAHALGLMVFIDVVYNHFDRPEITCTRMPGRFSRIATRPLGVPGSISMERTVASVRDFFVHNALYWLEEYHVDGLRFDAVHAILDDSETHIIAEVAERARSALPHREVHLVLENEANEARWLPRSEHGSPILHTAQWNDDLHHCWHVLLTGEADGYYAAYADRPVARLGRCLSEGFAYQGEPSGHHGGEPRGSYPATCRPRPSWDPSESRPDRESGVRRARRTAHVHGTSLPRPRGCVAFPLQYPCSTWARKWAASSPFLYFVDFADDEDLSRAVREGRRRGVRKLQSFAEQHGEQQLPTRTSYDAFAKSRLDWSEASRLVHAEALAETRGLLQIRHADIVRLR